MAPEDVLPLFRRLYEACSKEPDIRLSVLDLDAGEVLFRQGERASAFWIIVEGRLEATHDNGGSKLRLAEMSTGQIVGEIGALGGAVRTASVSALEMTRLVEVPATALASVAASHPELIEVLDDLIHTRVRRSLLAMVLPRLLGELDDDLLRSVEGSVEWLALQAGELVYAEGSRDDSLYLVVSGKLQAERSTRKGVEVVASMHRGDVFGEIALITGEPRSAAVRAVRDSELARIRKADFEALAATRPEIYASLARVVVQWLTAGRQAHSRSGKTFAVIPATPGVDPVQFSERIREAVARYGKLQVVSRQTVETTLCSAEMADALPGGPQQTLLQLWLEEWERSHDWTLYVADADETEWTRRCIRHSDRVILLVDPSEDVTPWIQKTIQALAEDKGRSVLVLVHRDKVVVADTARWLERVRPETHLHYRVGVPADAGRVGRCLTGQAVGLVLGGGGARGFAHVGVVRAMRELGIPIDRVGGTSMGAIVGGLVAMDASHEEIVEASRQTFLVDRVQHELTLPIVALNASQKLDRAAQRTFRGTSVEDLPVSYFCVSCDLTAAEPVIHRSGPLWRATRASGCLPGVFVPVVQDGHLLVDGGIVDNLPGGIMREDCGTVIVVDVSPTVDMAMTRDAFPSAWALLRSRLNPLEQAIEVPSIVGMLTRAAMVASARVAEVTREHAELVVQPPIQEFGLLEFERMEHIVEVGYQHALDVLRVAIAEGPLKELLPASTGTIDGDQASAPRPPEADPSAPPRPPSA